MLLGDLLNKAMSTKKGRASPIVLTDDVIELAVAYFNGTIGLANVPAALEYSSSGQTYSTMAQVLRNAIAAGIIKLLVMPKKK